VPGGVGKSYGIHVAELAGLPKTVLHRAREGLEELETNNRGTKTARKKQKEVSIQMQLFSGESAVEEELRKLEIDGLTPLEALNKLYELKKKASGG